MNILKKKSSFGIYLKPKEKVSGLFLNQLRKINAKYTKTKKFSEYEKAIQKLFELTRVSKKTREALFYLGGFLEGEASLNLGAKKNKTSKFKVFFDPEFNITQHINGISTLYLAMQVFQTGRIRFKSGSLATFVYTIDNRQALKEKIIPFYEKYVHPYGSNNKKNRVKQFKKVLILFEEKAHLDLNRMLNEMIPLWNSLRMQFNSNQSFKNQMEAEIYIKEALQSSK